MTNGPGPAYYLIPGFTHEVLKKNAKYLNKSIDNNDNNKNNEINQVENNENLDMYNNSFNDSKMINKRSSRLNYSNEKIKEEFND